MKIVKSVEWYNNLTKAEQEVISEWATQNAYSLGYAIQYQYGLLLKDMDNDMGDDHNYLYMEPPPKNKPNKESLTIFASDMYDALLECIEYMEHNEVGVPCLNNAKMLIHQIRTS